MPQLVTIPGPGPELAADLYLPANTSSRTPAVVTGSGFGGVKEMLLPVFGEALARAGVATLAVDYAGFGASAGEPRQDLVPRRQIADLQRGLDFLCRDSRIDPSRLGAFGPSMCGAHVLVLAGIDPRVQAAVSMVPFVMAPKSPPNASLALALGADTLRRLFGRRSRLVAVAGAPRSDAVMTTDGALDWIGAMSANASTFRNEITVRSLARLATYRPMRMVGQRGIRASLRTILSTSDSITPASLARNELRDVKHDAVEFPGSHFELFGEHLDEVVRLTVEWFVRHLSVSATPEACRVRSTQ